jgi:transcriptional regulator with XRE-family HTH domain
MLQIAHTLYMTQSQRQQANRNAPREPKARPSNRIRDFRLARGWSMEDLAVRAGTDRQRIYQLEHGFARLNEDWMRRLATAFEIAPVELLAPEDQGFVLSDDERLIIENFRKLSDQHRPLVVPFLTALKLS